MLSSSSTTRSLLDIVASRSVEARVRPGRTAAACRAAAPLRFCLQPLRSTASRLERPVQHMRSRYESGKRRGASPAPPPDGRSGVGGFSRPPLAPTVMEPTSTGGPEAPRGGRDAGREPCAGRLVPGAGTARERGQRRCRGVPRARSAARPPGGHPGDPRCRQGRDRKSTRPNSSHEWISYAVFCLKKKKKKNRQLKKKKKNKKKKLTQNKKQI